MRLWYMFIYLREASAFARSTKMGKAKASDGMDGQISDSTHAFRI